MLSANDRDTLIRNLHRNRVVLVAGAGFSRDAKNEMNAQLPTAAELSSKLWSFLYEDEPYDEATSLKVLYEAAQTSRKGKPAFYRFLRQQLRIRDFPKWYLMIADWFWFRIYTFNADNLFESIYGTVSVPHLRRIVAPTHFYERDAFLHELQLIKLHGCINDDPIDLTFGIREYGARAGMPDIWYTHFVEDYSTLNTLFVGTQLDEPLFWQYIQLRGLRKDREIKLRQPKSFLVSPKISKPQEEMLQQFSIVAVRANAQDFFSWLKGAAPALSREGVLRLVDPSLEPALVASEAGKPLTEVSKIEYFYTVFEKPRTAPRNQYHSAFLLGSQPSWDDIALGFDAPREINDLLKLEIIQQIKSPTIDVLLLYAAAGAGKSTVAKRVAFDLVNEGYSVFFSEGNVRPDPQRLVDYIAQFTTKTVLIFDQAGHDLRKIAEFCEKATGLEVRPIVLVVTRSNDFAYGGVYLRKALTMKEIVVPHLSDNDIVSVIRTLEHHDLLGDLRRKKTSERIDAFKKRARKQLLVAMREATSGRGFDEIIQSEFEGVAPDEAQLLYLIVAVASAGNYGLTIQQMISALALPPAQTMTLLEKSLAGIVIEREGEREKYVIRHPAIAEFVIAQASRDLLQKAVVAFLATIALVLPEGRERSLSRAFRVYKDTISHHRLEVLFPNQIERVRQIYEAVKPYYKNDGHYWLQYGSYELENGKEIDSAENYINQASALMPNHPQAETAYAHLLLKKANGASSAASANSLMTEGANILRNQMAFGKDIKGHPHHVFGSQMISYIRRWIPSPERAEKFRALHEELTKAAPMFLRSSSHMRKLLEDIKRAELETTLKHT